MRIILLHLLHTFEQYEGNEGRNLQTNKTIPVNFIICRFSHLFVSCTYSSRTRPFLLHSPIPSCKCQHSRPIPHKNFPVCTANRLLSRNRLAWWQRSTLLLLRILIGFSTVQSEVFLCFLKPLQANAGIVLSSGLTSALAAAATAN